MKGSSFIWLTLHFLLVLGCVCVCVVWAKLCGCIYWYVQIHVNLQIHVWKSEIDLGCLPQSFSLFVLKWGSPLILIYQTCWSMISSNLPISASSVLELQASCITPSFSHGYWDPNSGPYSLSKFFIDWVISLLWHCVFNTQTYPNDKGSCFSHLFSRDLLVEHTV